MTITRNTNFAKLPLKKSVCSGELLLRLSAPGPHHPFDAAHEYWPKDQFHTKRRDRSGKEHGPSEVYVG